jgi:hypothetical protein
VTPRTPLFALSLLLLAPSTWAVLGESASSVSADQRRLRGELRSSVRGGLSVHEITGEDDRVVREYVSTAGTVFAVAWEGPTPPDLSGLLGAYYPAFQQALKSANRRRGPLVVRTDRLVVEAGGHMRAFHGRAYLPDRLPASVTEADIR